MAKKLCNSEEEYEIFEEFVFHNLEEAQQQNQITPPGAALKSK